MNFLWAHHIASFFLFVAAILLLVVSISSPVANSIGFLEVDLANRGSDSDTLVFGNWGYCITIEDQDDLCTDSIFGYDPVAQVIAVRAANGGEFSSATQRATRRLTRALILHPIACGVSILAFLFGIGASFCGICGNFCCSFLAAAMAALSCAITVAAMGIDFWLFERVLSGVNDSDTPASASWGSCVWLCMVAFLCSLAGALLMLFTCCTARNKSAPPRSTRRRVKW